MTCGRQGRIDDITGARDFVLQLPWALLLVVIVLHERTKRALNHTPHHQHAEVDPKLWSDHLDWYVWPTCVTNVPSSKRIQLSLSECSYFWWFAPGTGQAGSTICILYLKWCRAVCPWKWFSIVFKLGLQICSLWRIRWPGRNFIRLQYFETWQCSKCSCPDCWPQIRLGRSACLFVRGGGADTDRHQTQTHSWCLQVHPVHNQSLLCDTAFRLKT